MKVCYFGDFDPEYSRNRIIINGLRKNGVEVLICNERSGGWKRLVSLFKKHRVLKNNYDLLIVGYSDSRWVIPLARIVAKRKIVWDAFYSIYDTRVFDRKLVKPGGFKAGGYWLADWLSCQLADAVLLDTEAQIDYFSQTFRFAKAKCLRVLVGADDEVFYPREVVGKGSPFLVHFHGKFIPLQGVAHIVGAAALLRDQNITFQIIGQGQEYKSARALAESLRLHNLTWINRVPYANLAGYMAAADLCLGIFGKSAKAGRVIPNKVYEAVAMAKPVITADSPAVRELFIDRESILLCRPGDSADLASKIKELKDDQALRDKISKEGHELFNVRARPAIIVSELLKGLASKNLI